MSPLHSSSASPLRDDAFSLPLFPRHGEQQLLVRENFGIAIAVTTGTDSSATTIICSDGELGLQSPGRTCTSHPDSFVFGGVV